MLGSLSGPSLWTNFSLELDIGAKLGTRKFKRGRAGPAQSKPEAGGAGKPRTAELCEEQGGGELGKTNVKWTFRDSLPWLGLVMLSTDINSITYSLHKPYRAFLAKHTLATLRGFFVFFFFLEEGVKWPFYSSLIFVPTQLLFPQWHTRGHSTAPNPSSNVNSLRTFRDLH